MLLPEVERDRSQWLLVLATFVDARKARTSRFFWEGYVLQHSGCEPQPRLVRAPTLHYNLMEGV